MKEEHRIEIAAAEWAYDKVDVSAYLGYIAGAVAEHEYMDEQLKQERNKAIDECIQVARSTGSNGMIYKQYLERQFESLKH